MCGLNQAYLGSTWHVINVQCNSSLSLMSFSLTQLYFYYSIITHIDFFPILAYVSGNGYSSLVVTIFFENTNIVSSKAFNAKMLGVT